MHSKRWSAGVTSLEVLRPLPQFSRQVLSLAAGRGRAKVRRQPQALPLALLEWAAGCGALAAAVTLGAGLASGGLVAILGATAFLAALATSQVPARPTASFLLTCPLLFCSRVPFFSAHVSHDPASGHHVRQLGLLRGLPSHQPGASTGGSGPPSKSSPPSSPPSRIRRSLRHADAAALLP